MPNYNYKNAKGGQMMINRLYTIERVARGLRQEINPNDQFPLWTQNKVATAQDRLTTAMQYLVSKKQSYEKQPMGNLGFFGKERGDNEKVFRRIGGAGSTLVSYLILNKNKDFKKLNYFQKILIWSAVFTIGKEGFGIIGKQLDV
jgi:hypothetical protein